LLNFWDVTSKGQQVNVREQRSAVRSTGRLGLAYQIYEKRAVNYHINCVVRCIDFGHAWLSSSRKVKHCGIKVNWWCSTLFCDNVLLPADANGIILQSYGRQTDIPMDRKHGCK